MESVIIKSLLLNNCWALIEVKKVDYCTVGLNRVTYLLIIFNYRAAKSRLGLNRVNMFCRYFSLRPPSELEVKMYIWVVQPKNNWGDKVD